VCIVCSSFSVPLSLCPSLACSFRCRLWQCRDNNTSLPLSPPRVPPRLKLLPPFFGPFTLLQFRVWTNVLRIPCLMTSSLALMPSLELCFAALLASFVVATIASSAFIRNSSPTSEFGCKREPRVKEDLSCCYQ
jgi:hypothetical protein